MLKPEQMTTENTENKTVLTCAAENPDGLPDYGVIQQTLTDGTALPGNFKSEMQKLLLSNSEQKQLIVIFNQQLKTTDADFVPVDAMVKPCG